MNEIELDERVVGVDLRQLRALIAVGEERSFRAAARRLGYAQSAVSHQIAALERALGARLVERPGGRHPVALTQAGSAAVGHGRRILERASTMAGDVAALDAGERGIVRVGVFQTAAAFLLAGPLGRFHRAHPGVELELVETDDGAELTALVGRGDLDLAFGFPAEVDPELVETRPLVDDPWVLLTRVGGRFAGREDVPLAALDGISLIAWRPSVGGQRELEETLARRGVVPRLVFRTNDNVALTRFVAAGLGHACVGSLFGASLRDDELVALPLRGGVAPRRIALCTPRRRPTAPAAALLVEEIVRHHAPAAAPA